MIVKEVVVKNKAGLHTRPAAAVVKLASRFKADFFIEMHGSEVNAKSIIGVMSLAAPKGTKLVLKLDGDDEDEAARQLVDFFDQGFGEQ
ncbi:MAG: HPr family phosphocarrier protein [Prosthecochloris sp.]|uniref:Phosphotransferase system, phosphocarrier protein HPr n=1 Tax=Prosthecochloris aestuarii (strain DSM 271 / SK 413) TaxID=290512 RepID=B4S5N9_PROA2|nr:MULTISPECIES: HPr family phosphocarrier protein [Prosthecochloris]ACF47086.1 Phosphotransferase system, phosphocarrier protein HPr [Prosthecochloris aestuarii DSM 271]MCW8798464.1 HPr family phosphocarrier protein [Prosthecochloris sp.]NEX11181.1 HPr family phosphocarrier protein [Prosthecochloris sp.]RDD29390.1 HPr family phosphocarrier protein [Prosthecochloris sp. ZM]